MAAPFSSCKFFSAPISSDKTSSPSGPNSGLRLRKYIPSLRRGESIRLIGADVFHIIPLMVKYQAVRGTKDILPVDAAMFQSLEATARELFARFGYAEIRTP